MLLNFEPFHRSKNTVGKQDYFSTRITDAKKIKTCCECLFTIATGEEHHQAIGFWDANFNDWRTCLKCYELQIELENTSARLNSMIDFRFGEFHKRLKLLRSQYPDEFAAFEDEFDLTAILKRIEKKKGWRDVPMQAHVKLRTNSNFIYCCQCSWEMPPRTRYEEALITENHDVLGINKTCLKCVEKREILKPYFLRYPESDRLLRTYRRNSMVRALRDLSNPHMMAEITDPQILKLVESYIAADKRFQHEAEEEFEEEVERRKSGFTPPTTPYEFKLKEALEGFGYKVIHNEPLGYYFPDLLIEEHKCICEVDGGYHLSDRQQAKDAYRTEYLNQQGYFVLRVSNDRVAANVDDVVNDIRQAIAAKENQHLG
jgi:very-short-patch-repair endonuclease